MLLALLAHAFSTTLVFDLLGKDSFYVQMFTRTATPMFVFMFGFMLEFVYARKARVFGARSVRARLLIRGWQCYAAYILTSLSAVLGGYKTMPDFLYSVVFFGDSRFGNILRVYAVILCMAPVIIHFRIKYGLKFLIGALAVVMLSFPLLIRLKMVDFNWLNSPLNILFGIGPYKGGPSVWHCISFVFAGMLTAASLGGHSSSTKTNFANFYKCCFLLIGSFALYWFVVTDDGLKDGLMKFVNYSYRANNMPEYFTIGVIVSVATISMFCMLIGTKELPRPFNLFLPLGLSSLTAYTAGNMLLNLFGSFADSVSPVLFVLVFLTAVLLIVTFLEKLPFYAAAKDIMHLKQKFPVK